MPRRAHRTRGTDAYYPRAHVINAHALAQVLTVKDMWIVYLRELIKSQLSISCVVAHCLSHSSLRPLNTSMSQKPCATPQGGLNLGRLAQQSPLTWAQRKQRTSPISQDGHDDDIATLYLLVGGK